MWERKYVTYLNQRRTNVLTYLTITIRRSYIFKYTVFTVKQFSSLYSNFQNIKELIYQTNTPLVIYINQFQLGLVIFICLYTCLFIQQRYYLLHRVIQLLPQLRQFEKHQVNSMLPKAVPAAIALVITITLGPSGI